VLAKIIFTFIHLADAFIQSDLPMRTIEAVQITIGQTMCYDPSQFNLNQVRFLGICLFVLF